MIQRGIALLLSLYLMGRASAAAEKNQIIMDSVTGQKVDRIIFSDVIPFRDESHGEIVSRVSSAFLGTPYQAGTLTGGFDVPEALVANLNAVDCFTLADDVEALARSRDRRSFLQNLATIRYAGGQVSYFSRRHFFQTGLPLRHALRETSRRISVLTTSPLQSA